MNTRLIKRLLLTVFCFPLVPLIGVPDGESGGTEPEGNPENTSQGQNPTTPDSSTQDKEPETNAETEKLAAENAKLKKELEDARKAVKASEIKKRELEKAHKSDAELQADIVKEAEETKAEYQRKLAEIESVKVFTKGGMTEEEYAPLLELVAGHDTATAIAIAIEVVAIKANAIKATEKATREKVMKETPQPPVGNDKPEKDPFLEAFEEAK